MKSITLKINTGSKSFRQLARDVLCTAVEGGIAYWAEGRKARRNGDLEYLRIDLRPSADEGAAFKNGDPRNEWQTIGLDQIAEGMRRIAVGETQVRSDIRKNVLYMLFDPENGDHDVEIADAIIQAAMFNKVEFG
jgi:hypothetical protein